MSIARHHVEWLSLVEVSGPFVSLPVLMKAFPQGLDAHVADLTAELRLAYNEWRDNQSGGRPDPAIHRVWAEWILRQALEMPEKALVFADRIPDALRVRLAEHGETLQPDFAIVEPGDAAKPRLLVTVVPDGQDLEKPLAGGRWVASPATRMMTLLHATGVRLGIVTNGERWMLVDAPKDGTTGYISWFAELWLDEPLTLRAFRTLLGAQCFFGVADDQTIEALLAASANDQQEVTDQLGYQVRRAVEVLVQAIDLADEERGRQLLADASPETTYEAAITVMMRLVFLFCAEERDMLLLGDPLYDQHYAVSTLLAQLRESADQHGEEVLERRFDAWYRLLATFRAVHGGLRHDRLTLPAYGGSLFDPDRFPFLEGRAAGTTWRETPADPIPVNDRTVLHLLEALQMLQVRLPGGGPAEARRLSFRALDIEQIGHIYEGLLDHTAKRAPTPALGLAGTRDREPEIALPELEALLAKGEPALVESLEKSTGRSASALKKALAQPLDLYAAQRLRAACGNDDALAARLRPFAGLVRDDSFGHPTVIRAGSLYVTAGQERRATGTHYTPRSLTEPIVEHTLEPLVYVGPAEGLQREQWRLRSADELLALKVCDMAMGSGAFLVQACRYLSERLVEAWAGSTPPAGERSGEGSVPMGNGPAELLADARRLVVERCLYGVDKNHLAVEMAKLSLWLITLDKGKPFDFLDHALKRGDSLVGVDLEQLRGWSLKPTDQKTFLTYPLQRALDRALGLRARIRHLVVRDVRDAEQKARWLREADEALNLVRLAGDCLVAAEFAPTPRERARLRGDFEARVSLLAEELDGSRRVALTAAGAKEIADASEGLCHDARALLGLVRPLHWPLEFPEAFADGRGGFDAFVGNPPFMGGRLIGKELGEEYRDYLAFYRSGRVGSADLSTYFMLRAFGLSKADGDVGLIATSSIADTGTRMVGLEQIVSLGGTIYRAESQVEWPGGAAVYVSVLHIRRGSWHGANTLDSRIVPHITASLDTFDDLATPYRLLSMAGRNSQGVCLMGEGFVLSSPERQAMLDTDPHSSEIMRGYFNGSDLNTLPEIKPERYVIDFGDLELSVARSYKACFERVARMVKPFRDGLTGQIHERCFWKFWDRRPRLQAEVKSHPQILASARVTKYLSLQFVSTDYVYNEKVKLFFFYDGWEFSCLQSNLHDCWARWRSGTLGATTANYSTSESLDTFPLPAYTAVVPDVLGELGLAYHDHRRQTMLARKEGLTATYNRFHDSGERATDIAELRALHVEMDGAVAKAYGWSDLDLEHGFHETQQGRRYTIGEPARREVLARLLRLNHERHEEEVKAGLHEKQGRTVRGRRLVETAVSSQTDGASAIQTELF